MRDAVQIPSRTGHHADIAEIVNHVAEYVYA